MSHRTGDPRSGIGREASARHRRQVCASHAQLLSEPIA